MQPKSLPTIVLSRAPSRRGTWTLSLHCLRPTLIALPPDGPIVTGREAVKQLWAAAIREHGMTSCALTTDMLDFAGDVATEVGHATMTLAPPGGKSETARIKYLVVWKRINGTWLLHRDIWNAHI